MPSHPEAPGLAGVILAAGSSTRMGRNKLLLDVGGEPLVRRTARIAFEAGLAPVVVVLGHDAGPTRAALDGLPCLPVVNPDHAQGKGTSLQVGIKQLASTGAAGAVVMLADMPFVTAAMVAAIVERARASNAPLVVSRYGDVNAPPMLYDRSLFAELLSLPGEACGKEMVRRHRQEAALVSWPEEALVDIDVPDDYQRVRARIGGRGGRGEGGG
jgi:molybdenum cofactor cytidylyltransferase